MPSFVANFLPGFEVEMQNTRTMLEAVPDDNPDYRPHEKSMRLGRLAGHVAGLAAMPSIVIQNDKVEMNASSPPPDTCMMKGGKAALLAEFDKNVATSRAALTGATDQHMAANWQFFWNGQKVLDLPRTAAISGVFLNHLIHHRGQLTVYIRLLNGKVPGLYGPSADEQ